MSQSLILLQSPPDNCMDSKVVLITGASSGIGRACAKTFANRGATVVAVGRNNSELAELTDEVTAATGSISITASSGH